MTGGFLRIFGLDKGDIIFSRDGNNGKYEPETQRKVVSAMRNHEGTFDNAGNQDLRNVSELVGLALQAGKSRRPQKEPITKL